MGDNRYGDGIKWELLDQLLMARGTRSELDFESLAGKLTKALAEGMLNTEIDFHLEDSPEQVAGNHRNGTSPTTVDTGSERMALAIPRDRKGPLDSAPVAK